MQALTGLFARQFGTPNYAAHGGFCSVNMAAGMIYTIGGSFWEFGGPDLERARLFVMIGTAEDHHSNPLKIAISKFKRDGGRFISINPMRTGYSAIADEWVPIKPGTDGALLLALIHELIALGLYDREFLVRYTNAGQLVNQNEARRRVRHVRAHRGAAEKKAARTRRTSCGGTGSPTGRCSPTREGADPFLHGDVHALRTARRSSPRSSCCANASTDYTPEWAAGITGIPADDDPPAGARDGHHRARPEDRAADRLDRCLGQGARHGHRQPGRLPRHARDWPRTPTASRRSARWRS